MEPAEHKDSLSELQAPVSENSNSNDSVNLHYETPIIFGSKLVFAVSEHH